MTKDCLACAAGLSIDEYCKINRGKHGCTDSIAVEEVEAKEAEAKEIEKKEKSELDRQKRQLLLEIEKLRSESSSLKVQLDDRKKEIENELKNAKIEKKEELEKIIKSIDEANETILKRKEVLGGLDNQIKDTTTLSEKLNANTKELESDINDLKRAIKMNQTLNENELEKMTNAEKKRLEAESATAKMEAAQNDLKIKQDAMKNLSDAEKEKANNALKKAVSALEDAKKKEKIALDAAQAAQAATDDFAKTIDAKIKTLASLQAELEHQKEANADVTKSESQTEDGLNVDYVDYITLAVFVCMMMFILGKIVLPYFY